MNLEERKTLANKLLNIKDGDVLNHKVIDENAIYFYEKKRGGKSIIIGKDLSFLAANSSIDFDTLFGEFNKGRRTTTDDLISKIDKKTGGFNKGSRATIDDLISKIDKKIEDLEKEEK